MEKIAEVIKMNSRQKVMTCTKESNIFSIDTLIIMLFYYLTPGFLSSKGISIDFWILITLYLVDVLRIIAGYHYQIDIKIKTIITLVWICCLTYKFIILFI